MITGWEWGVLLLPLMGLVALMYFVIVYVYDEWRFRKTAPYVWSYFSHKRILHSYRSLFQDKTVIDLGCGDGEMLRFFTKKMWAKKWIWYEIRHLPLWLSKILNKIYQTPNCLVIKWDMFVANIREWDVIYLFLWKSVVESLEKTIFERCQDGVIIVTNTFHFTHHKPYEVVADKRWNPVICFYKKTPQ
jgi:hypothetical protein